MAADTFNFASDYILQDGIVLLGRDSIVLSILHDERFTRV